MRFFIKMLVLVLLIFPLFMASSNTANSKTNYDFSDTEDDVVEIFWNEDKQSGTYRNVSTHPDFDILGLNYAITDDSEAQVILTVKGEIQTENSYYWIVISSSGAFQINVWFGLGWASATSESMSGYSYSNGTRNGNGEVTHHIEKDKLTLTLSRFVIINTEENVTIQYPISASNNWDWHVSSWNGNNIGINSGTWYVDYAPNGDNSYLLILDPLTSVYGFEVVTLFIAFFITYFIKKKLKLRYSFGN